MGLHLVARRLTVGRCDGRRMRPTRLTVGRCDGGGRMARWVCDRPTGDRQTLEASGYEMEA